jgi:hypothetical protein
MTIDPVKVGGWGTNEALTSTQINQLQNALGTAARTDLQLFVDTGVGDKTWTKPAHANWVRVYAIAQGGNGASGNATTGGGGGGSGQWGFWEGPADFLEGSGLVIFGPEPIFTTGTMQVQGVAGNNGSSATGGSGRGGGGGGCNDPFSSLAGVGGASGLSGRAGNGTSAGLGGAGMQDVNARVPTLIGQGGAMGGAAGPDGVGVKRGGGGGGGFPSLSVAVNGANGVSGNTGHGGRGGKGYGAGGGGGGGGTSPGAGGAGAVGAVIVLTLC